MPAMSPTERRYRVVEWDRWADDGGNPGTPIRRRPSLVPEAPAQKIWRWNPYMDFDDVKNEPLWRRQIVLENLLCYWRARHLEEPWRTNHIPQSTR